MEIREGSNLESIRLHGANLLYEFSTNFKKESFPIWICRRRKNADTARRLIDLNLAKYEK